MVERDVEQIVQALKNHLGSEWNGVEVDGRDEMINVLKQEFGYDNGTANAAIDALVESREIQYVQGHVHHDEVGGVPPVIAPAGIGGMSGDSLNNTAAAPFAIGGANGYWRIGRSGDNTGEDDTEGWNGRRGQAGPSE